MNISQNGIDIIKKFEGFRAEKYICPAGKKTIGYGHVIHENDKFKNKVTLEEAESLLLEDLKAPTYTINQGVFIKLNQNQFDALASLIFNWGGGKFLRSEGRKRLNRGDLDGAWDEFMEVVHVNGIVNNGLVERREEERKLFYDKT